MSQLRAKKYCLFQGHIIKFQICFKEYHQCTYTPIRKLSHHIHSSNSWPCYFNSQIFLDHLCKLIFVSLCYLHKYFVRNASHGPLHGNYDALTSLILRCFLNLIKCFHYYLHSLIVFCIQGSMATYTVINFHCLNSLLGYSLCSLSSI